MERGNWLRQLSYQGWIMSLLTRKEFNEIVDAIEEYFNEINGELRAIDEISLGFESKEHRLEGYNKKTKKPCFYYQRASLLSELLSAQSDFFDDCTPEQFNKFIGLFSI